MLISNWRTAASMRWRQGFGRIFQCPDYYGAYFKRIAVPNKFCVACHQSSDELVRYFDEIFLVGEVLMLAHGQIHRGDSLRFCNEF